MEIANFVINVFIAIGTVGATIVSLVLANRKEKPKIKVMASETVLDNKKYFSIVLCNNEISRVFSIKELGYKNKFLKRWINIPYNKIKCMKRDYTRIDSGRYEAIDAYLNEEFKYGQELVILLEKEQVKELICSNKKKKVKIYIIFLGENKKKLKVSKKYLRKYID